MERFWSKVDKNGPVPAHRPELGPCWIWTAYKNEDGYGKFGLRGSACFAHRVCYELEIGVIPKGKQVLHKCDNPPCVNPAHLFLGTQPENIADMTAKGRRRSGTGDRHGTRTHPESFRHRPSGDQHGLRKHPERAARGDRNGSRRHPERLMRGSSHYRTTLTEDIVRSIRRRAANGETHQRIANDVGVSRPTISLIIGRSTWAHVE